MHRISADAFPIQQVDVVWQVQTSFAIAAALLLSIGLRLAFWVHRTDAQSDQRHWWQLVDGDGHRE